MVLRDKFRQRSVSLSYIFFLCTVKITPQELRVRYKAVEHLKHKIEEPIDILFNAIEDMGEIAELARRPHSTTQIVNLGYIVVSKIGLFGATF